MSGSITIKNQSVDLDAVRELAAKGATNRDLAASIGVNERTLSRWRDRAHLADMSAFMPGSGLPDGFDLTGVDPDEDPNKPHPVIAAIDRGRQEAKAQILDRLNKLVTQEDNWRLDLALLKRLDSYG